MERDSKVRTFKVCYDEIDIDPTKFTLQVEVWSRMSNESMWLSILGDPAIIDRMPFVYCEEYSPKEDYVLTELQLVHREFYGIS